jgi:uncharacterized protein (TIGR02266 family)
MTDQPRHHIDRARRLSVNIRIDKTTLPMFLDSEIMNLSKGGVFIRSDICLATGNEIDFEFTLPKTGRVVRALGVVVWTRKRSRSRPTVFPDHPLGMGVQFKKLEADDVNTILDEIEALLEKS